MFSDIDTILLERGWVVVDLPDPSPVEHVREGLLADLRAWFPDLSQIEQYHTVCEDERHDAIVHEIAKTFWAARYGDVIVTANFDLFRFLIGPDLHVQHYPYLRVVRPHRPEDAVPLHRDTYYGASPFEVSVVVPFTDMGRDCALRAIPGSHTEPDTAYPFVQTVSDNVAFGSPRHRLGYAYAPRLLDPALDARAEPIPVRVGQAVIFGLSLVHGGGTNSSDRTRFSTDIRVVNSFAPVNFSRGVRADYYVPLSSSPVSCLAQRFLACNESSRTETSESS
jgi:hypothetical protein